MDPDILSESVFPALAYIQDMSDRTGGNYGVNEALLATALGGIVFGTFSCQPLTIVGITGLINLFNYTTYDIIVRHYGASYLPFMGWVSDHDRMSSEGRLISVLVGRRMGCHLTLGHRRIQSHRPLPLRHRVHGRDIRHVCLRRVHPKGHRAHNLGVGNSSSPFVC